MKVPQVVLLWVATLAVFIGCGSEPPKPTFSDLVKQCQIHGGVKAARSERIGDNARKYRVTCRDDSVLYTTEGE